MPVNEVVVDELTISNLKTVAGFSASINNLMLANAASNQQRVDGVMAAALGKIVKDLTELDIAESVGNTVLAQVATKGAQTTPPQTG